MLLNWIILLIGNLGIPIISLEGPSLPQQYVLSFLTMNFHFFGDSTNLIVLIISWCLSISVFGIFVKIDWKIPLLGIFSELSVYIFAIVLLKRHAPITFSKIKFDLLKGYAVVCAFIVLLYIPIIIRYFMKKRKENKPYQVSSSLYISKCPHCGQEFQSNPKICFVCSKHIITS